ncbi:MAG: phosphatidylglycerophosphatase A [Acetobacteraceae bacterium]|nr:phosphatidylglycerophosphatase A [Acetobacteraceae bacterium]
MDAPRLVATLGGIGLLRPAPGTWGSAVVLPLAWLGPLPCLMLAAAVAGLGVWAIRRLAPEAHDPGWVVVDEAAGMLLALAAVPTGAPWPWMLAAFLLFRLFDIVKWGPVGWADRRRGPTWVMLDDVIAGAMAAAVLLAARGIG